MCETCIHLNKFIRLNKYTENLSNKPLKLKLNNKSAAGNLKKLHPAYVTGFCDGEACFHLAIGENARYKLGYYVNPGFSISLGKKDEDLLLKLK